jgi:hypothetical protein
MIDRAPFARPAETARHVRCSPARMRFLHLLVVLLFLVSGCLGSTVVGEGEAGRDDRGAGSAAATEAVQRTLATTGSTGALLECTFDTGAWPGTSEGTRFSIVRSGAFLYVHGRAMRIDRVDKSGPQSSYVSYFVTSGDETLHIEGSVAPGGHERPMLVVRRFGSASNESCNCAEANAGEGTNGVFDDAQLDALVTMTNGRR